MADQRTCLQPWRFAWLVDMHKASKSIDVCQPLGRYQKDTKAEKCMTATRGLHTIPWTQAEIAYEARKQNESF